MVKQQQMIQCPVFYAQECIALFCIPLIPEIFKVLLKKYKKQPSNCKSLPEIQILPIETEQGKQCIVAKVAWSVLICLLLTQAAINAE